LPTTLAQEQAEQRRWKLRPEWAHFDMHQRLVQHEFLAPEDLRGYQDKSLRNILAFAGAQVPYYQDCFARLGIAAETLAGQDDLRRLPVLGRAEVQARNQDLRPDKLPRGQKPGGLAKTSGSTGQPVEVAVTALTRNLFVIFKQRQLRWARFDPLGRFGLIRPPSDLPAGKSGGPVEPGETLRRETWQLQVGRYFETGPLFGFTNRNPVTDQVDWLAEHKIDYLQGQSAELEHLALAARTRATPPSLRGLFAISQQMTAEMRNCIEETFSAQVQENYGLNEIGIVASRCREGGRYHVNVEHCLVEIVDAEGQPVPPGQRGHLVVTSLNNFAMPLLRYDSGDLAEAVDGPCPCGRTLPAFGRIHGRYRRIADLPEGTFMHFATLRRTLADLPPDLARLLRQYQVHQYRDGSFELRLLLSEAAPEQLTRQILAEWEKSGGADLPDLTIRYVDVIPRPPGGKFQDFTSDFALPPHAEAPH
jgi:phenylacetate-CoA ligase